MNQWSNILYLLGRYTVLSDLSQCIKQHQDNDEPKPELVQKVATLRKQLKNVPLKEMAHTCPEQYRILMILKESVSEDVITDVWTQPYSELIEHIDELCRSIMKQDQSLSDVVYKRDGIFDILRIHSHCDAFIKASVADKALLIVSSWGRVSFESLRLILQVFFGLNDTQILAILLGRESTGGLLRISQDENELFDILEPVHSSCPKAYSCRSSHDDLLMLFYPYLPVNGSWTQTHPLYHAYRAIISGDSTEAAFNTIQWTKWLALFDIDTNENSQSNITLLWSKVLISLGPEYINLLSTSILHTDVRPDLESAIMQRIAHNGVPIRLEDLCEAGVQLSAKESDVMNILWSHLYELVICRAGESVRIRRVSEFYEGIYFDVTSYATAPQTESRVTADDEVQDKLETAMHLFEEQYIHREYNNLAEKVYAFMKLWDDEIQLKDLQTAGLKLGFTESPKSISRVLRSYKDKFYSCEPIGKRGVWCTRETAIRLGYDVEPIGI